MKVWTAVILALSMSFGLLGCNRSQEPVLPEPQVTVPTVTPNIPDPTVDHNSTSSTEHSHAPTDPRPDHRQSSDR